MTRFTIYDSCLKLLPCHRWSDGPLFENSYTAHQPEGQRRSIAIEQTIAACVSSFCQKEGRSDLASEEFIRSNMVISENPIRLLPKIAWLAIGAALKCAYFTSSRLSYVSPVSESHQIPPNSAQHAGLPFSRITVCMKALRKSN